jgi:hypothetical protein
MFPGGRNLALQDDRNPGPFLLRVGEGDRRDQRLGVRVEWLFEDRVGVGGLDDAAQVHDGDAIRDVANHGQVVGDEEIGQTESGLQVRQQVHDLGLDRDVESGDGFVEHDEVGVDRQRPGDVDALALPTGELVWESLRPRGVQADQLHQFGHLRPDLRVGPHLVDVERLCDRAPGAHPRIQRVGRILEHDLHPLADHAHALVVEARQLDPSNHTSPAVGSSSRSTFSRWSTCRSRSRRPVRESHPCRSRTRHR